MVRFQICSFCQIFKLYLCWQSSDFVGEISMLNLYIFLPGVLFFSLKDEILCVGNPWFSGPNTTFQSPKSTFSSRLKAFNARSLQRFSTCVLCNRFCVGYTKATMIHFTSLAQKGVLPCCRFFFYKSPCWRSKHCFASRPVGDASLLKTWTIIMERPRPSMEGANAFRSSQSPCRGSPTEGGRALHSSQSPCRGSPTDGTKALRSSKSPCRGSPTEEGRSTLLSLLAEVLLCHDVVAAHAQCKD